MLIIRASMVWQMVWRQLQSRSEQKFVTFHQLYTRCPALRQQFPHSEYQNFDTWKKSFVWDDKGGKRKGFVRQNLKPWEVIFPLSRRSLYSWGQSVMWLWEVMISSEGNEYHRAGLQCKWVFRATADRTRTSAELQRIVRRPNVVFESVRKEAINYDDE